MSNCTIIDFLYAQKKMVEEQVKELQALARKSGVELRLSLDENAITESISHTEIIKEALMQYRGYKLHKREDGRWCAKYPTEDGGRKAVYGRTQKQCYNKLKEALGARKKTEKVKAVKLYDWLDTTWLDVYKRPHVTPGRIKGIQLIVRVHIKPHIKNLELRKITPLDIEQALQKVKGSHARKDASDVYHNALKQAYKNRLIKDDVASLITKPKHKKARGKALTVEQRKKFLDSCKLISHGAIFEFYYWSGARKAELLSLRWEHIKDDTIYLPGTKTDNAPRHIPKFKSLSKILDQLPRQSSEVFKLSASTLTREAEQLSELCGFRVRVKDLRTTFATVCFEQGMPEDIVAKWLGHSTKQITKDHYIIVMDEFEKKQAMLMDTYFTS